MTTAYGSGNARGPVRGPGGRVHLAEEAPVPSGEPSISHQRLRVRERINVLLVIAVTQGFRLLLVSVVIGVFFVGLGTVVIQPDTIELWTGAPANERWFLPVQIGGETLVVTQELIQVSIFLGAFAGLYFSVYTTTNKTLRREFFEDTIHEIRQNLAVRGLYLGHLDADTGSAPHPPPAIR